MAPLSGSQIEQLAAMLLDVLRNPSDFDLFLQLKLGRNRAAISNRGSLSVDVKYVILDAESNGWSVKLLEGFQSELRSTAAGRQDLLDQCGILLALAQAPEPMPPTEVAGQLARLVQVGLDELGERRLAHAQLSLQENILHVKRMAVYKDAHDELQEVEAHYNTLYPDVYPEGALIAADQIRWTGIQRRCLTMRRDSLDTLLSTASASFLKDDEADMLATLQQAGQDLETAVSKRDLDLLDAALQEIYEIIRSRSPRMNTNILAEVKELRLQELADALRGVYDAIRARHAAPDQLDGFGAALDRLAVVAGQLTQLRDDHDRWQLIEDDLRREADQLPTRGVEAFRRRWQKSLGTRLKSEATGNESWAVRLSADIADLEAAMSANELAAVSDVLYSCRLTVTNRFRQVDDELKRVCDGLREASIILERELEFVA